MSKNDLVSSKGAVELFNQFDKNGDGKISCDELKDVFRELGSETMSLEEAKGMVAVFDKDGDGSIDIDEFSEVAEVINGGSIKELRDAFDHYDLDKNGLISASELHEVMKRLGQKCSVNDCVNMIASVDADGDGHVNFNEFKKMMNRN